MNHLDRRLGAVVIAAVLVVFGIGAGPAPVEGASTSVERATAPAEAAPVRPDPVADNGTRIVHAGGTLTLESGAGQPVNGRTGLPAGTELTVRVRSPDDAEPYLRAVTTTVDENGRFRAVFDLSDVPAGTSLQVLVHRDGRNLTRERADVVECTGACPPPTPAEPSAVVTDDGGSLALTNRPGQVVGGRTNLPPGSELTVHVQSNAADRPFLKQTTAVVDRNGTFRSVFGFDDLRSDTEVRVTVVHDGTALTTARATVQCVRDCEASTPTPAEGTPQDGPLDRYADAEVGVVQVANGSVARVRIRLGDAGAATLTVGGPETDYVLNVTLADGNDDGEVVLLLDTAAATRGTMAATTAAAGDRLQVHAHRGRFVATEYRLALHPPRNRTATVATGLLVVTQDGATGTPFVTGGTGGSAVAPAGIVALAAGTVLAVLGLGSLLGLFDLRRLLGRR